MDIQDNIRNLVSLKKIEELSGKAKYDRGVRYYMDRSVLSIRHGAWADTDPELKSCLGLNRLASR